MLETGFVGIEVLWGVKVWQVALALALIIASLVARSITDSIFGSWLKKRAAKTAVDWDDDVVELAPKPVALAFRLILWYAAAIILSLPQSPNNVRLWILTGLELALWIAVIYLLFAFIDVLSRVLERMAARTETVLDDQLSPLLRKALKVLVAAIFLVMFVQNMGIEVGSLLAGLGIGGLALALAAKDTVANYFGSIIIFIDQPFQIGDIIEIDGTEGVVEEVRFRTTLIRKFDKSLVTMPNQNFTNGHITNYSRRPVRRIRFSVGVTYDTTPEQMRRLLAGIKDVLKEVDGIEDDTWAVAFEEFADSSLNVLVNCYSKENDWLQMMAAREELMLGIMDLVEEMGLEIAFPTRTVHLMENATDGLVIETPAGEAETGKAQAGEAGTSDAQASKVGPSEAEASETEA